MKHYSFLFLFSFFSLQYLQAQVLPIDPETKHTTFQETITIDSLSQEELYNRSIQWLTSYYKTTKFDVNDKAGGKTGTEGYFIVSLTYDFKYKSEHNVSYNLMINQKAGKYRYSLTDFQIYNAKTGPKSIQSLEAAFPKMTLANKKELLGQLSKEVQVITDDLKSTIASGKPKDKNEW